VISRIAPDAQVIDITHGIGAQDVLQGALVLADTLPYFPVGTHVAVVDPGVGSDRKALAVRSGDGRVLVGPDNGILLVAAEKLGGVEEAVELTSAAHRLEPVSKTFHGRDIFSPAAAHLAAGVELADLGPSVPGEQLVRLDIPKAEVGQTRLRARILYVDRFGNVQLGATREDLEQAGIVPGALVEVEAGLDAFFAVAARTFADVRPGDVVLYEDAYGNVSIALNGGSAAQVFAARPGRELMVRRLDG
jgi:S-adenosyl-L-methionine hydrolase (adenosine-forming)